MISTEHLRNKLRELGYTFHDTTDRTNVWRKERTVRTSRAET